MPNSIVFPGGAIDRTDETKSWINSYKKIGINNEKFEVLDNVQGQRPFIFQNEDDDKINR